MKRALASVLALTLVLGGGGILTNADRDVFSVCVSAEDLTDSGTFGESITWKFDKDGTLTVSGTGDIKASSGFDYPWNKYAGKIKNLVIEEGITSVGYAAFENCFYAETIKLPESVTSIGASAVQFCEQVREIKLPSNLEYIDMAAFGQCKALESVDIPAAVKDIMPTAFEGCVGLHSISVAPENKNYISVDNVLFTKDMSTLLCYASKRAGSEYTVPESVRSIRWSAFDYCSELETLNLGANVEKLDRGIFRGSEKLAGINVSADNSSFKSTDGVVFSKDGKTLVAYPVGKGDEYTIPAGVEQLGEGAFVTAKIKKFAVTEGVKKIGLGCFENCSELTEVTLPESLEEIAEQCFVACGALKTITIPENVKSIGDSAFTVCFGLESIIIENADCEIYDSPSVMPYKIVMKGHDGSTTEAYATKYDRKFESLDKQSDDVNKPDDGNKSDDGKTSDDKTTDDETTDDETTSGEDNTVSKGDANGDNDINVTDIAVTAAHIKGIKPLTEEQQKAADVNGDEKVNVTDIALIASHIKGIKPID